jgi:hypothetical protein
MKSTIRAAFATSRTALQTIIHGIPRHTIIYAGPPVWHINDIMVNIAFWEYEGAKSVEAFLVGQEYATKDFAEERINCINATIYAAMHDADNHQIDEYVRNGRFALIDALTRVAERDMQRSMLCPWNTHHTVDVFAYSMITHEQEHTHDISARLIQTHSS